jgi:hypothetical protein
MTRAHETALPPAPLRSEFVLPLARLEKPADETSRMPEIGRFVPSVHSPVPVDASPGFMFSAIILD